MAANHRPRTYTFEFLTMNGGTPDRQYRNGITAEQLLEKFDKAANWMRRDVHRYAYVWGPGVLKQVCNETTRSYIEDLLEKQGLLALDQARYVGLLWADLGDGYAMYKLRKETARLDGFERPNVTEHQVERVADRDAVPAVTWAHEHLWKDRGIWMNDKPAVVWGGYWRYIQEALLGCVQTSALLPDGDVILAPCRYDRCGAENRPYPYVQTTRSVAKIQDHRSRWPNVGDDMRWVPKEILIRKYGYGKHSDRRMTALAAV